LLYKIAGDPSSPIVITEGELKSACCTKHVYPCMGLGGVYSFRSAKRGLTLIPEFYAFEWRDRKVVVAFDSDARTNTMVAAARNALCKELLALGAVAFIAEVPAAEDGRKQGLDDLVLAEGAEELKRILDAAEPFAASAALHELNAEVAYIVDPGMIVVVNSGLKMRANDFTSHAFANRHHVEQVSDGQGNIKLKKVATAKAWLEWPGRAELRRVTYSPGEPRVTDAAEFNTWPGWGQEPKKGDVKPWKELLDFLFRGKPEERLWFERWCAIPLQKPGAKLYTACVLWGVYTGTGKSLTGYTLSRIYGKNFTKIGDQELADGRNEWAEGKQFVLGDDVTGHEQRKYADRLKAMITQHEMRIDRKYVPTFEVPDRINYLFTSNHPDAFFLEDDDRRFFVHEVHGSAMDPEFYRRYMAWINNGGASHLFAHLLALDLGGQLPEDRAPDTQARRAMVEDGLSDLGAWVRRLRDDPDLMLRMGDVPLTGDLWSSTDLLKLYQRGDSSIKVTAGGVGRELKRAGVPQAYGGMQIKTSIGQTRLFVLRNHDRWTKAKHGTAASHYEETRQRAFGLK
jgi:hypothetical protein